MRRVMDESHEQAVRAAKRDRIIVVMAFEVAGKRKGR